MLARLRAADCHGMISCLERVKHRYPAPERERAGAEKRWPVLMVLVVGTLRGCKGLAFPPNAAAGHSPKRDICAGIQSIGGRQAPAMDGTTPRMARTYPLRTRGGYPVLIGTFFSDFRPGFELDFQAAAAAI